jgi:hypothetical protein
MLERERRADRGDPDGEAGFWPERVAACARMRAGYQELAAGGELDVLRSPRARLQELGRGADALMADLAGAAASPGGPGPEGRRRLYGMLRLKVAARSDGAIEAREVLGAGVTLPPAMAPARTAGPAARADASAKAADDGEELRT